MRVIYNPTLLMKVQCTDDIFYVINILGASTLLMNKVVRMNQMKDSVKSLMFDSVDL